MAYTNYLTDARVRREAETLAALQGYKVSLLALKESRHPRTYKIDGVEVIELNIKKYRGKSGFKYLMSYLKFMLLSFFSCNSLTLSLSGKRDVVHVHNMPDFLVFSAILSRLFGTKVVLDIHDSMPETYCAKFESSSNRLLFRTLCWEEAACCWFADKVICVNHIQRDALIRRGIPAHKIEVSMNVPDHKRFNLNKKIKTGRKSWENVKLVYHGTITKRLGVDLAIRAVANLIDEIPGLEFHILGHGDDIEEFIELSKNLGAEKCIYFSKKMVPLEDLVDILSGMDLGIVSNRRNIATELMLPVKMLEYVALNLPVVAPRLKTIEYYFTDEMVSYFEPENVNSLAHAILRLYRDESRRRRQVKMAKNFLKRYGWERHQLDLVNLYEEI